MILEAFVGAVMAIVFVVGAVLFVIWLFDLKDRPMETLLQNSASAHNNLFWITRKLEEIEKRLPKKRVRKKK